MHTINRSSIVTLLFLMVFLGACQRATQPLATPAPSDTASPTSAQTSSTAAPSIPVATATETSLPEPTPTDVLIEALPEVNLPPFNPYVLGGDGIRPGPVIDPENAGQVFSLGKWGMGTIYEVDLSPDGSYLAVRTALGVGLYEAKTMGEIHFLELSREYGNIYVDPSMYNLVEFSPQGQLLAVVVESQVHLLKAEDGSLLGVLEGEGENYQLMAIAFSADGRLLAGSEGWSADVNIWQVADGKLVQTWEENPPTSLTFSPGGQILISSNGEAHRVSDGSLIYILGEPGYGVIQVMFSADGEFLVANDGVEGKLGVWKTANGEPLYLSDWYARAVFSPDGQRLTLVYNSGEVQTISTIDGSIISSQRIDEPDFASVRMLAFSADGSRLATSATGGMISVWDLSSGQLIYRLAGHFDDVSIVEFSPQGNILISADREWIRTWEAANGRPLESMRLGFKPPFVSPDGSTLVTDPYGYYRGLRVWNAVDGSLRYVLKDGYWPVAFSADSSQMAVSTRVINSSGWISDTISVYATTDGSLLAQLTQGDTEFDDLKYDLAFSPDGSYLASVHDVNDLAVWKMPEGELLYELRGQDHIPFVNLAFSPDGQLLATGNDYHTVLVFRAADGERLVELPMEATEVMGESGQVSSLAFSPDGKLLVATDEGGFYQLWRLEDWETLQHNSDFINQMSKPGVATAFSPDGSTLAIGGTGNVISLWHVAGGELLTTLRGHTDDIVRVGFSPDGSWLYSASLDGTVRFWGVQAER